MSAPTKWAAGTGRPRTSGGYGAPIGQQATHLKPLPKLSGSFDDWADRVLPPVSQKPTMVPPARGIELAPPAPAATKPAAEAAPLPQAEPAQAPVKPVKPVKRVVRAGEGSTDAGRTAIAQRLAKRGMLSTVERIAKEYRVDARAILGCSRKLNLVAARHHAWATIRWTLGLSLREVAALFGVDFSAIAYGVDIHATRADLAFRRAQ